MRDCKRIITFDYEKINNIPCIGLGTYGVSKPQLDIVLNKYNYENILIDTASRYGNEKDVGECIKQLGLRRKDIFLISKISFLQQNQNDVEHALKESLHNLQVDYVDLYLIHSPRHKNTCRTWQQMIQMQKYGLARYIGVSNFNVEQLKRLYDCSGIFPSVNQIVLNSFSKEEQFSIISFCEKNNIIIQAAQPFKGQKTESSLAYDRILKRYYSNKMISIFGTTKKEHLDANFSLFLAKESY